MNSHYFRSAQFVMTDELGLFTCNEKQVKDEIKKNNKCNSCQDGKRKNKIFMKEKNGSEKFDRTGMLDYKLHFLLSVQQLAILFFFLKQQKLIF